MASCPVYKVISMNILFSSDDNYARHMGVAIYSVLLHNMDEETIRFYVIDNHISQPNIEKLKSVVHGFKNADIYFFPFDKYENQLHLNLAWPISISSYARLFIGEMLPDNIDRVLYMDCDVVVNDALEDLWRTELNGNILGAVQDTIPSKTKASVGLLPKQPYFNAGVLLIDLDQWRLNRIGKKSLEFIDSHRGRVTHHDQGVLNGLLKDQWERIPLKYNVMTIHYMLSPTKVKKYYKDESDFYGSEEIINAKKNPIILHFTPSFTVRPWEVNCAHPYRTLYYNYLNNTPWFGIPNAKAIIPWYVRILNLRFRYLPII